MMNIYHIRIYTHYSFFLHTDTPKRGGFRRSARAARTFFKNMSKNKDNTKPSAATSDSAGPKAPSSTSKPTGKAATAPPSAPPTAPPTAPTAPPTAPPSAPPTAPPTASSKPAAPAPPTSDTRPSATAPPSKNTRKKTVPPSTSKPSSTAAPPKPAPTADPSKKSKPAPTAAAPTPTPTPTPSATATAAPPSSSKHPSTTAPPKTSATSKKGKKTKHSHTVEATSSKDFNDYIERRGRFSIYGPCTYSPSSKPPHISTFVARTVTVNETWLNGTVGIANYGINWDKSGNTYHATIAITIDHGQFLDDAFIMWIAMAGSISAETDNKNRAPIHINIYTPSHASASKDVLTRAIEITKREKKYLEYVFRLQCVCRTPVNLIEEARMIKCSGDNCKMRYHPQCIEKHRMALPGEPLVCGSCLIMPKGICWGQGATQSCSTDNALYYAAVLAYENPKFLPYLRNNYKHHKGTQTFVKCVQAVLKGNHKSAQKTWWEYIYDQRNYGIPYQGQLDGNKQIAKYNLYGSELEMVWKYLAPSLEFLRDKRCTNEQCPQKQDNQDTDLYSQFHVDRTKPVKDCLETAVKGEEILYPCPHDDCNGNIVLSPIRLPNVKPWMITFNNDLNVGDPIDLFEHLPKIINIGDATYRLRYMSINEQSSHYTSIFYFKNEWLHFDDMRQDRQTRICSFGEIITGHADCVMYVLQDLLPPPRVPK